ncbi:MAG TPA: NAD(P)/FAD-dependent oxidoreductase [Alphaproteobacteria bacterium]|jgi:L-2-hydroxyglutarate oxidase LhgO
MSLPPVERADAVVIGAGVVGLAVARALALAGREVIVLEAADAIGTGTSSRNSEVIHAGIYYPKDSLKARLCVAGSRRLFDYCASRGVGHRRCGKLIVAADEAQMAALEGLRQKAHANGATEVHWIEAAEAKALEPALACVGALSSPMTGIVDSHGLMLAYQGEAEERGAVIAFNSPVEGGAVEDDGILLNVGGATPMRLKCRLLVNSAGLTAPMLARRITGLPPASVPASHYCKGNYFTLAGRSPFTRLIYPAPEVAGLGVHLTLDMAGQAKFGPDVQWLDVKDGDPLDYVVDPRRGDGFYAAIRTYWPGLPDGALQPGYAGIRPKVQSPSDKTQADFIIQGPADHGVAGLVNLYGIESPGLTSSVALADAVAAKLGL